MGNKDLSTIPEKESDEFIKSSVEDLVPIPSEFEDTSESDNDCDLPLCDDFSPINISKEKFVTFSNPLFDSNDDFTSSDDKSLSDEDVPEENETDNHEKDKNKDKTELEMEKCGKTKSNQSQKSTSQNQSQLREDKSKKNIT
ncbi:hypothetical protein Tco_1017998 [Tanacetum coccineum]|uniref:Uncharacterized protein n=1 Tax=Tanacetum coccineum TaxID=301880 RepID=A0ABQ5FUI6_9ASTR